MGFEFILIFSGASILVVVILRRRLLGWRMERNRQKFSSFNFENLPEKELFGVLAKAPALRGDGKFAVKAVGTFPFADNFESIRLFRRFYFVEPTEVEVLLIPDPANFERKAAVAVTLDARVLGYLPVREANEIHSFLLAHSSGVRARAKFYLGSRREFNAVALDLAIPMRLEFGTKRKSPQN